MDTKHCFNDNFAPNWFRCKCGVEVHRTDMEQRKDEECPTRVQEEAHRLATDPVGAKALARCIEAQERALEASRAKLRNLRATCSHDWEEPKYTPKIREAYTIEGDPPGTMGIDWRGPQHVPRKEIPVWTRTCRRCGTTETTTKVTEKVTTAPRF